MEQPTERTTLESAMASVQAKSERFSKGNVWVEIGEEMATAMGEPGLGALIDKEAVAHAMDRFKTLGDEIAVELGYKNATDMSEQVLKKDKIESPIQ